MQESIAGAERRPHIRTANTTGVGPAPSPHSSRPGDQPGRVGVAEVLVAGQHAHGEPAQAAGGAGQEPGEHQRTVARRLAVLQGEELGADDLLAVVDASRVNLNAEGGRCEFPGGDARPHLGDPHSSALRGEKYRTFRELRCDCGKQHHRIIFRRSDRFFILLHMILNKEGEIPEQDKQIARERWDDFVARMDATPTAKPRAMGNDAP